MSYNFDHSINENLRYIHRINELNVALSEVIGHANNGVMTLLRDMESFNGRCDPREYNACADLMLSVIETAKLSLEVLARNIHALPYPDHARYYYRNQTEENAMRMASSLQPNSFAHEWTEHVIAVATPSGAVAMEDDTLPPYASMTPPLAPAGSIIPLPVVDDTEDNESVFSYSAPTNHTAVSADDSLHNSILGLSLYDSEPESMS